jgi:ABC-type uncharacterized transport system ATPase subunit
MDVEGRRAFRTTMREFAAKGKTVLFATHYLEEADAYADRAILIARGKIVASGPTTEIKAMVGTRTIRATLPGADLDHLGRLPGVTHVERRGEAVVLNCSDSDRAIRALLEQHPEARDIEISGAGLEQFMGAGALAESIPSYWLVQASRVSLNGHSWRALGWLVVGTWTVVLIALSAWAYERDTKRQ